MSTHRSPGRISAGHPTGGAASGGGAIYSVTGGTATGGGIDYTLAAGTVSFGRRHQFRHLPVALVDNALHEPSETVVITLSNPTGGAVLGTITAHTLTILDGDTQTDLIFRDGFENGNTSAWDVSVP